MKIIGEAVQVSGTKTAFDRMGRIEHLTDTATMSIVSRLVDSVEGVDVRGIETDWWQGSIWIISRSRPSHGMLKRSGLLSPSVT